MPNQELDTHPAERFVASGQAGGNTFTTSVTASVKDPLVTLIPTLKLPVVAGVPLINPVPVSTPKPDGSPVALKLVGLLMAVIW